MNLISKPRITHLFTLNTIGLLMVLLLSISVFADDKLEGSPKKGGITSILAGTEKHLDSKVAKVVYQSYFGVQLKLELIHTWLVGGTRNTKIKEVTIWSHFEVPFVLDFDETTEFSFEVEDGGNRALISSSIFRIYADKSKELIASPKVFTNYDEEVIIEMGGTSTGHEDIWKLVIEPSKEKIAD